MVVWIRIPVGKALMDTPAYGEPPVLPLTLPTPYKSTQMTPQPEEEGVICVNRPGFSGDILVSERAWR